MKSLTWKLAAGVLLAAVAVSPAAAQTLPAGNDGWSTPGGGQTKIDLNQYPNALAALGSPLAGSTLVPLKGKPLNPTSLGTIDTLLERGAVTLANNTGSGDLKIVALSLESEQNIVLQDGRVYKLDVSLSGTPAGAGSITLTKNNQDGGTFSSTFPVLPKLTFTNLANGTALAIDCGAGGCPPLSMSSTNSAWVTSTGSSPGNFNPEVAGVTAIQSGITVGGYTTIGNLNGSFYAGFAPSRQSSFPPSAVNEQDLLASHNVLPVQDCKTDIRKRRSGKAGGEFEPLPNPGPGPGPIEPEPIDPGPIDPTPTKPRYCRSFNSVPST